MTSRYRKNIPNILMIPGDPQKSAMGNFEILADYARSAYRDNEISKEFYLKFMEFIIPLCLEQMIENKFNEIIPKWNKRFSNWLYPNLEETS